MEAALVMVIDDVRRLLSIGIRKSVCLAAECSEDYPGYVRSVFVRAGNKVSVEFDVYGMDEGGAYFEAVYNSLEAAVDAVCEYLDTPLSELEDLLSLGRYPSRKQGVEVDRGHSALRNDIQNGRVRLPAGISFRLTSTHWKQFENV